jgi:hypothetical protein
MLFTQKTDTSYTALTPEGFITFEELEKEKGRAVFYMHIENPK